MLLMHGENKNLTLVRYFMHAYTILYYLCKQVVFLVSLYSSDLMSCCKPVFYCKLSTSLICEINYY